MFYLLKKDCKEFLGSKKRIGVILTVLIILIISTYCNMIKRESGSPEAFVQLGIVDQDNSPYSKLLLEYFSESESFSSYINIVQGGSDEIGRAFRNGELDITITIPEKFAENMIYIEHLPVKVMINTQDTTKAVLLQNILESYEKYIRAVEINCVTLYDVMTLSDMESSLIEDKNLEISYDLIFTALGKEDFFRYKETGDFPSTGVLNYYLCAVIAVILIYSGLYAGFQLLREKQQGAVSRLIAAGTSINTILLEKIIFSAVIVFIAVYAAYLFPSLYLGNVPSWKTAVIYMAAILSALSFAVMLSGIFQKAQSFMIAGNFVSFLFIVIGGGIIPIMNLPSELVVFAKFTPVYWFIRILLSIQRGMDNRTFLQLTFALFTGSVIFYTLSCLIYSKKSVYLEE